VGERRKLHEKLEQGVMDAALVHQPHYWPGMQVEELLEEKLILVRSVEGSVPYVYVDWGEHFCRQHDAAHPEWARSGVTTNLGPLALRLLLEQGGSGYFRTRVVQSYLDEGLLVRESSAPEFSYPIYLVFSRERSLQRLEEAFAVLREVILKLDKWRP
jgi:DNA-binding transcriptional LysR family regulator